MTWMRKSTAALVPRDMRLKNLQLVIDEQSLVPIKPDSWCCETKTAGTSRTLEPPTDAAIAHNATYVPFRDWCLFHVVSCGRSSPHRRVVVNKTADTPPKFQTDEMFIRMVAESKTHSCITFVETRSGVVISCKCSRKGDCEGLMKEILRHFEAYDFLNPVIIQCNKEMSVIDVCRRVAHERNARTVLRSAPKTNDQSNLFVEAVQGHIQGFARCYQTQIETNTGIQFSAISLAIPFFDSLRWICALKIDSATICSELHMCDLCACLVNRYSR